MSRTQRATNHFVSIVRKQQLPISEFRLSREDNHPAKGTFRKLPNPRPLSFAALIVGQDSGEGADEIILWGHECHLPRPIRLQRLGWMNKSSGDDFLPAVGSGNEILFGTVREAGEGCIV